GEERVAHDHDQGPQPPGDGPHADRGLRARLLVGNRGVGGREVSDVNDVNDVSAVSAASDVSADRPAHFAPLDTELNFLAHEDEGADLLDAYVRGVITEQA